MKMFCCRQRPSRKSALFIYHRNILPPASLYLQYASNNDPYLKALHNLFRSGQKILPFHTLFPEIPWNRMTKTVMDGVERNISAKPILKYGAGVWTDTDAVSCSCSLASSVIHFSHYAMTEPETKGKLPQGQRSPPSIQSPTYVPPSIPPPERRFPYRKNTHGRTISHYRPPPSH